MAVAEPLQREARVVSVKKLQAAETEIAELKARLENQTAVAPDETISVRLQATITQLTTQRDQAWQEITDLKETIAAQDKVIVGHAQGKIEVKATDTPELKFIAGSTVVLFAEKSTPRELFYMERYLCAGLHGWDPGTQAATVESAAWRFNGKDSMNRTGAYYEADEHGRNILKFKRHPEFSKNAYIECIFRIVNPDIEEGE